MWRIFEHRDLDKKLTRAKVPLDVLKRHEKWKDVARLSGPQGLKRIRGFRDEALKGRWSGFRSSRFGQQWRVIYRVEGDRLLVQVLDINPHDYSRK